MTRRHIPRRERARIFARADGRCHICGQKIDAGYEDWQVEHVIPLGMGGTEEVMDDNLQPAHVKCHRGKTAQDKGHMAKATRMQQRDMGIKKQTRRPLPGSKASGWKQKLTGEWVRR